jgi:ectoine hydroxylase-related dioxygenase (phytanoyl-CoA dioxygenase family)
MKLTDRQIAYFRTFGFLAFPGHFADEIGDITDAFESVWANRGGGHHGQAHDRKRRSAIVPFIDQHEYLCTLIDDPRIEGVVASLLGDDFNYTGSDGNFYVGDTNWHSDGYTDKKYASLKIAFYLDVVTKDSGCLRVIPGSHHFGDAFANTLHEAAPRSADADVEGAWGVTGAQVPAVPLESEPGDMVVFNHAVKHSSFGGGSRRRMFTINMQERHSEENLPALRDEIGNLSRYWSERAYGETIIRTAGPRRMKHLEQRLANDGHLAELTRKAREEMREPSRGGGQFDKTKM